MPRPALATFALISALATATTAAQTTQRVAQLQLGGAQMFLDATADGRVAVLALHNRLEARAVLTVPQVRAWLDIALVVTAAHDPRRRGVKWTYASSAPDLFLYREVTNDAEQFTIAVGSAVKVAVVVGPSEARQLLDDIAVAARTARSHVLPAGGACVLELSVATRAADRLEPADSAALWMDRIREQIEMRLATFGGAPSDAGRGVWFWIEQDGAVGEVRPDSSASRAVTDLRDAVVAAGGWHAFRGVTGGKAMWMRARLAPRCAK